jgi:hypothetical protein
VDTYISSGDSIISAKGNSQKIKCRDAPFVLPYDKTSKSFSAATYSLDFNQGVNGEVAIIDLWFRYEIASF